MSVRAGERAAVEILEYMDTEQAYMGQALSEVLHRKNLTGLIVVLRLLFLS